jgi:hypothetical protein
MDETVLVRYVVRRDVFVDGQLWGFTNIAFTVETGTHTFDLGDPVTYLPPQVTVQVVDTLPQVPLVIKFEAEL